MIPGYEVCPICDGEGMDRNRICPCCEGRGEVVVAPIEEYHLLMEDLEQDLP